MATSLNNLPMVVTILAAAVLLVAHAGDPDSTNDFEVPPNVDPKTITSDFFTFTGLRQRGWNATGNTSTVVVSKVTIKEFAALGGQGVSMVVLDFPPGAVNPPHVHPRGGELLMLMSGALEVGLVDSTNKLFAQTIVAPDMFVFPKGLLHFQVNVDSAAPAVAVGMFGSANAGTLLLGPGLFGSGIDVEVLAKAFKTDEKTISEIVKNFE